MTVTAGIDVGGTKVLGVAVAADDPGTILAEHRVPTPEGEEALVGAMAEVVGALGPDVSALGVGIAGLVDLGGVLRVSPNLPGLHGVDIVGALERRLDLPVQVDNDATCAAWGEHVAGAARGADVLCVTLGTGIGAGIIAAGEPVRGAHGFGGEVGHMVVDPDGPPCPCGRWGCWERFASGTGLGRLGRDAAVGGRLARAQELAGGDPLLVRPEHVSQAAQEGDAQALAVMDRFARWVAVGIGNLVTILDCALVVVGGGLVELGDLLLEPVRAAVRVDVMSPQERLDVRIVAAELGEHAGAIGAALLAHRETKLRG